MKNIISAEEQWRKEINVLIDEGYECDEVCDGLGAVGDNECFNVYNGSSDLLFTKVGDKFEKIYYTDASEEYLLANNWQKLNPDEDWYDHKAVLQFLIDDAKGKQPQSPIEMQDLLWMGIFEDGDCVRAITFEDKEVEVSTEEINAIRAEIVERCKGHSIEEVRDMFDGYNWGEYGEGSFDFQHKGFTFTIAKMLGEDTLVLSNEVLCESTGIVEDFEPIILPFPPKEIKVDVPDKVIYEDSLIVNLQRMILHVRAMANLEIQRRWDAGQNFTEDDMGKWDENYFHGLLVSDNKFTLMNNEDGILCLASNWRKDKDYEYLDTLDTVPVDELLCILEMMH